MVAVSVFRTSAKDLVQGHEMAHPEELSELGQVWSVCKRSTAKGENTLPMAESVVRKISF